MASVAIDKYETLGIQRLAAAVLLQAITDLHRGTVKQREGAAEWFQEEGSGVLTFPACCEILDRDPADVRNSLMNQYGVPRAFLAFFEGSHQSQAA